MDAKRWVVGASCRDSTSDSAASSISRLRLSAPTRTTPSCFALLAVVRISSGDVVDGVGSVRDIQQACQREAEEESAPKIDDTKKTGLFQVRNPVGPARWGHLDESKGIQGHPFIPHLEDYDRL